MATIEVRGMPRYLGEGRKQRIAAALVGRLGELGTAKMEIKFSPEETERGVVGVVITPDAGETVDQRHQDAVITVLTEEFPDAEGVSCEIHRAGRRG